MLYFIAFLLASRHNVLRATFSVTLLVTMLPLSSASAQSTNNSWSVKFSGVGIFSSPRVSDLNGDGIGDIIFGAGREEFKPCDTAIFALDGSNGQMLWKVAAPDHLFTSAMLKDINADGTEDVIMGGRSAHLVAINGKNGNSLWTFNKKQDGIRWFNFYNGQFVPDQDNDGMEDLLIANGGNVLAPPYEKKQRFPGNLIIVSSRTGNLISRAPMPDGNEIYMSVVVVPTKDGKDYRVAFGTGGETLGGSLYVATLNDIRMGKLDKAIKLHSSTSKGYIAPPLWIDLNNDDIKDLVANSVSGSLLAFDGQTLKPLWEVTVPQTEAYSSIAPGFFTGDDNVPDLFVSYAVGQWPDLGWSKQVMVDGLTGKIAFIDSLGSYQTSTPVIVDVDNDGTDEAIINVNVQTEDGLFRKTFQNILALVSFKDNEVLQLGESFPGSNISSTPWLGDLDNDNLMDIVYCHGTNVFKTYAFTGMQVHRIETGVTLSKPVRWNSYMGNRYNGVFETETGLALKKQP